MADNDNKHQDQFNASLPLPVSHDPKSESTQSVELKLEHKEDPAANLIRKKIRDAYANEPSAKIEVADAVHEQEHKNLSRHQQFILELTNSEKPMREVQTAWHEYYSGLSEQDKHQVWQEFYEAHPNLSKNDGLEGGPKAKAEASYKAYTHPVTKSYTRALHTVKKHIGQKPVAAAGLKKKQSPMHSLIFGLSVGMITMLVFLFGFFNEQFIAPFIQPSRTVTSTPIISSTAPISTAPEVLIPKINVQIPVVYTVPTADESQVEAALENGVVHYADTAMPGQNGNVVIVGHSSNNIFNPGKYKFAFVLLSHMEVGDTFYLQKDGVRYTYQIFDKKIVKPNDVSVLGLNARPATATLITCDPPGTSTNRLVVIGEQIDPNPANNSAQATNIVATTQTKIIPSNSTSLWARIVKWLTY